MQTAKITIRLAAHFAKTFFSEPDSDLPFIAKIVFSDRTTYYLCRHMNLQNIRIGVSSNLHAVIEGTRDSPTFNITCAGFEQNMFSPFIFGEHIVTGVEYLDMLKEFVMTVLEEEGPNNMLYQQYFMLPNFHSAIWELTPLFLLQGVHKGCCLWCILICHFLGVAGKI